MKRILSLIMVFMLVLSGCNSYTMTTDDLRNEVNDYINDNNLTVLYHNTSKEDEQIIYETVNEIGIIHFSVSKNGLDIDSNDVDKKNLDNPVQLLHLGNDENAYFGVVILDQELFNESKIVRISFLDSNIDPLEISLGGEYTKGWLAIKSDSLTSCAVEKFELISFSDNVTYVENFIPT
ncbi:hypothetical protein RI065_00010 [Mycoplasmatota bacterium zrk1]